MIVSMNKENSDSYLELFTEAYEFLQDEGYIEDTGKERFNSLAEYYSHMADFFNSGNYKYVMLPLQEEPFKIDLNNRAIEVPQSFANVLVFNLINWQKLSFLLPTDILIIWIYLPLVFMFNGLFQRIKRLA